MSSGFAVPNPHLTIASAPLKADQVHTTRIICLSPEFTNPVILTIFIVTTSHIDATIVDKANI